MFEMSGLALCVAEILIESGAAVVLGSAGASWALTPNALIIALQLSNDVEAGAALTDGASGSTLVDGSGLFEVVGPGSADGSAVGPSVVEGAEGASADSPSSSPSPQPHPQPQPHPCAAKDTTRHSMAPAIGPPSRLRSARSSAVINGTTFGSPRSSVFVSTILATASSSTT